jgi:hypothetical protein
MPTLTIARSLVVTFLLCSAKLTVAADPVVDRAIEDAKKKYPPGDYPDASSAGPSLNKTVVPVMAEADTATKTIFENLMSAVIANDYDAFIAQCDAAMKAALTKGMLDGVSKQIAPRTQKGYETQYLGALLQRGYKVHLWRLRFKDGGDDILATLSVREGKAGGFYLR